MIVNDLLQSLGCQKLCLVWSLWSSMIFLKASVNQICFLFDLYDRQWSLAKPLSPKYNSLFDLYDRHWSLAKPLSPKYVFYLVSMIVSDLLQSLGRPKMCVIYPYMIVNDLLQSLRRSYMFFSLFFMIVNDLLQSLGRLKMYLVWSPDRQWSSIKPPTYKYAIIWFLWSSMIFYKDSVTQKCFLFGLYDRKWSSKKPR